MNKVVITKSSGAFYFDGEFIGTGYWIGRKDFILPRLRITDKKLAQLIEDGKPFKRDKASILDIGEGVAHFCKELWDSEIAKAVEEPSLVPLPWAWLTETEKFRVWQSGERAVSIAMKYEPFLFNESQPLTVTSRGHEKPVVVSLEFRPVAIIAVAKPSFRTMLSVASLPGLFKEEIKV